MARYRIVMDSFLGYEVQRRWFGFLWIQCGFTNTHSSIERAEAWAANYHGKPVKEFNL